MKKRQPNDLNHLRAVYTPYVRRNMSANAVINLCDEIDDLRAALVKVLNLGQETCATHEDQCFAATEIARRACSAVNPDE